MSLIEIISNDSNFLNLITGDIYKTINKFVLNKDINNDEHFYNMLELFQSISNSKLIEKIHKFEYIKLKINSIPEFEQKNTINIENIFNLPRNFMFNNVFLNEKFKLINDHIDLNISEMENLKICINSIFKYLKNKTNKIEYDALRKTIITYKNILETSLQIKTNSND